MAAKKQVFGWTLFVTWLLCAAPLVVQAKQAREMDHAMDQGATAHDHGKPVEVDESAIGVDEKIGGRIPLDIELTDVNGRPVLLDDVLDKPTLLMLVFYNCPSACSMIQSNAAHAVNNAPHQLGKDFRMVTVSFDDEDTPENAKQARTDFTKILKDQEHAHNWSFFTADANNIKRLTDAVGFTFMKTGAHSFVHPNLVTMVSGRGKVIRYLYGMDYLPFDIGMAVTEAFREEPGISIKKIVSYCFDYDPKRKRYAFNIVRVFGAVTLAGMALLFVFLLRKKN